MIRNPVSPPYSMLNSSFVPSGDHVGVLIGPEGWTRLTGASQGSPGIFATGPVRRPGGGRDRPGRLDAVARRERGLARNLREPARPDGDRVQIGDRPVVA